MIKESWEAGKQRGGEVDFLFPGYCSVSDRQKGSSLPLEWAKVVLRNMRTAVNREGKNHPINRVQKSQWLFSPPTFSFPAPPHKPRNHLEAVEDRSGIGGTHRGVCSPEHPKGK